MAKSKAAARKKPSRATRTVARETAAIDEAHRSAVLEIGNPITRPLKAYAFDPTQGRHLGNRMSMAVRYQELDPGPVVRDHNTWDGIAVVDYDATHGVYYKPVDLDDPRILIRGGLDPIEADPRFHQQMVYAVVTDTIQHFEAALGRRIHWRRVPRDHVDPKKANDQNIYTLNIFPHAMVAANAFYSPQAHGILFGYFRANDSGPGRNLPGQVVYTCLSHDIVVHETTHAIIDGIRRHFMDQTNPDVAAFHEAFADVAALFRHFTHQEALLDTIQRTGGMLFQAELAPDVPAGKGESASITAQVAGSNPLVHLAQQFGEATGLGKGLRSALATPPNSNDIQTKFECHERGAILVAAIFDAYFTIYQRRTAGLFRIYRSGGGNPSSDIPVPLARMLAEEASRLADLFFNVCVRALDYCPPVDITFGDFLRAVVTSDFDLHPLDETGLRDAFMQAFRVRGIVPDGSSFFSDTAIAWPEAKGFPPVQGLVFGDPNGLTSQEKDACKRALQAYVDDPANRGPLGFAEDLPITVASFHPVFRINQDGSLRTDMVVEAVQERDALFDAREPGLGRFPMRGGATIIISKPALAELRQKERDRESLAYGNVRFVIAKQLSGEIGQHREARQRNHFERAGLVEGSDPNRFQIDFALTHGGF
jgi:hypothetical protein